MDRQTGKTRKMRVIDSKKVITFPKEEELDSDIYSAIYGIIDDKAYSLLAETDKAGRFKTLLEAIRED